MERVQKYQALLKVTCSGLEVQAAPAWGRGDSWVQSTLWIHDSWSLPQELIRNKARNRQNCALLEQAYAVVSALPQRAENKLHVSLMENYPGTLEALGEPIRQVGLLGWRGPEGGAPCEAFGGGSMWMTTWL